MKKLNKSDEKCFCFMSGNSCEKNKEKQIAAAKKQSTENIFVIMPFTESYFDTYTFVIKESCKIITNSKCLNATESAFERGEYIICKICQEIVKADCIIADLSENNSNVLYELGLAHALNKKVIIIQKQRKEVYKNANHKDDKNNFRNYLKLYNSVCEYSGELTNLKSELDKNLYKFKSNKKTINNLESLVKDYNSFGEIDVDEKNYTIVNLIPTEIITERPTKIEKILTTETGQKSEQVKKNEWINFNEVFEFGIKKSIRDCLSLKIKEDNVININSIATNKDGKYPDPLDLIIKNIQKAIFCIIDISEGYPEAFYWLGFIHGLGLNYKIKIPKDISYIYIKQGPSTNIPFDLRAAKVISYDSLKILSQSIKEEIEKVESQRIRDLNKAKFEFLDSFQTHTRFLIGASVVFYPACEKMSLSKISDNDFKTYDNIVQNVFSRRERLQFTHDMKIINLMKFIKRRDKDEYLTHKNGKDFFDKITDFHLSISKKNNPHKFLHKKSNYIIVGSSVVNAITELIMANLYVEKNINYGYFFLTKRVYKALSYFWLYTIQQKNQKSSDSDQDIPKLTYKWPDVDGLMKEDNLKIKLGIYMYSENMNSKTNLIINEKKYHQLTSIEENIDLGLLIIANDLKIERIFDKNIGTPIEIHGQFVVLCGFREEGTILLGELLAYYRKTKSEKKIIYLVNGGTIMIDNLFKVINKVKRKYGSYCIEAVFEIFKKKGLKRKPQIRLVAFWNYDRVERSRTNLLNEPELFEND